MGLADQKKRRVICCLILAAAFSFADLHFSTFVPHIVSGELMYTVTSKTLKIINPREKENYQSEEKSPPTNEIHHPRKERYLLFPEGSSAGILVDMTFPLGLPMESVFITMNFESNYDVLDNVTQLPLAYIEGKQFSRKRAYGIAESWLSSLGMRGRACLLRTICETAERTLVLDSLAAEIIRMLFTPSSSSGEQLSEDIREAERLGRTLSAWDYDGGRNDVNCTTAYPSCPISPFSLFTAEGEGSESGRG